MARDKPKKFDTLEDALRELKLMDFDRVLEYRIVYHRPDEKTGEREHWTVKRKIMDNFAFGKPRWTNL